MQTPLQWLGLETASSTCGFHTCKLQGMLFRVSHTSCPALHAGGGGRPGDGTPSLDT